MSKRSFFSGGPLLSLCLLSAVLLTIGAAGSAVRAEERARRPSGFLVKKEKRTTVVSTEYGEISAARVTDNINGSYLLHFFTLDPNSLLLPLILHADMIFYVHTGSGKLSWTEEDELRTTELRRGDVYRLEEGAVFFLQSNLETTKTERQKLRIHAIFADPNHGLHEPISGAYSSIREMVLGFDRKVLQAAFNVPAELIDEILDGTKPPAIIHGVTKTKRSSTSPWEVEAQFVRGLLRSRSYYNIFEMNKKKTKKGSAKLFNLFKESKDFENCNGWSTTVTRKKLSALKGSDIGLFMVNLTAGSMMGPHWNPTAAEVAVVLQGRGMVRVVCASISNETECKNARFEVEEGDIFVVPRFNPMAQMAFNNETLVFMGFSSSAKRNHPQYLAGQASVFRTLDRDVLALSFNVSNTTLDQLVAVQQDSVILGCVSCAEEESRIMEEEREKKREEEAKKREEERKREEEEARKREEEAAKREEEERQRREEEEAAAKKKEEEERKRQEEEARRKEEEEEVARREEEERQRRAEEEEEETKRKEEEEAARREEEERRKREEEEAKRKEEEEAARREEEERERREEEEEKRKRHEEEAARREEEKRERREEEEEERKRHEEEVARREEEERERRRGEEAEAERREEEQRQQREEEKAREREQEQEEAREREQERREEEEERRRHQEEEARRREEEEQGGGQSEGERAAEEERRREEEAQREEQEERERERGEEGEGGDEWGAVSF